MNTFVTSYRQFTNENFAYFISPAKTTYIWKILLSEKTFSAKTANFPACERKIIYGIRYRIALVRRKLGKRYSTVHMYKSSIIDQYTI